MAKAMIERDPVVEPNEAPPVPNKELYIARRVAISVRVRRSRMIFPTMAQGVDEQQDFIRIRGKYTEPLYVFCFIWQYSNVSFLHL